MKICQYANVQIIRHLPENRCNQRIGLGKPMQRCFSAGPKVYILATTKQENKKAAII
jgi:hypothetical protein